MRPMRLYANSFNEALEFVKKINPICSTIVIPDAIDWLLFNKPFKITINYEQPTLCIEIYVNKYETPPIKTEDETLKQGNSNNE